MQLDISCDESLDILRRAGGNLGATFGQLRLELGIECRLNSAIDLVNDSPWRFGWGEQRHPGRKLVFLQLGTKNPRGRLHQERHRALLRHAARWRRSQQGFQRCGEFYAVIWQRGYHGLADAATQLLGNLPRNAIRGATRREGDDEFDRPIRWPGALRVQ